MLELDTEKIIEAARVMAAMRLEAAAIHIVNKCRENLSRPGRTKTVTTSKSGKAKTRWGRYGSAPSAPGDFPAKQRGILRASIAYFVDPVNLTAKVGTSLRYGRYLEFGTRGREGKNGKRIGPMAPRPWLLRTLREEKAAVSSIMSTGKAS
jgi:hypothetical protein